MLKNFYCPICGEYQKEVDLRETGGLFYCKHCKKTIRVLGFDELKQESVTQYKIESEE